MSEVVIEFLNKTFGVTVAIVATVLLVLVWIIIKITTYITRQRCDKETFAKEQDSLRLELKDHIVRNNNIIDDVRKDLSMIKGSLEIIKAGSAPLMESNSPISLTKKGWEVMQELDAEGIIARNWATLIEPTILAEQEKLGGLNAYQLQTFAIETSAVEPERFYTPKDISEIQSFAFNKGMPDQLYLRAMGIIIRDKYFEKNKIMLDEVDRTNPNSQNQ